MNVLMLQKQIGIGSLMIENNRPVFIYIQRGCVL